LKSNEPWAFLLIALMIYLHKILPLLLSPLWWGLGLLMLFIWTKKRRFGVLACLVLVVPALPLVANRLTVWVEGPYQWQAPQAAPVAKAIVVLSGTMEAKLDGQAIHWDLQDGDRVLAGVALMKARRAPVLIFTGGRLPWNPEGETEGQALQRLAVEWGVPESQIVVTADAFNTEQEALAVDQRLGPSQRDIILVTSAFHMRRAQRTFEQHGLHVTPWPVDYKQTSDRLTLLDFLPQPQALNMSTHMMREAMGRLYYQLKWW
jgi:uncharacterized SAM-binding protein YcdF (DUF218 family)